ncbi:TonB-dependent receptor [Flavobacteriaceae bacterium 14752]|uniref:TonB-dependent receptor n=1 Tax=Mesohalobacter salilacus TaxID=2491711 RepID=UPI000F631141|nr:TonB-dependent receptor [Flavobacteriaceae bacterium 14752]
MKHSHFLGFLLSIVLTSTVFAQQGRIQGTIQDGELNDILPFANVIIKGTQTGTTSDFEGKYSIELEPGTYTVEFSYVGYQTVEISEVVVKPNDITTVNVTLNATANSLEEVTITTTARRNTEQSVLNLQKKSIKVMDGLSSEGIKRTGASNVASAVKRIPGVSVQGGKYVFVRGLGDRYTKSILNGMDIPGLDPDRNTLQMDIIPSNIIENVIVSKTASADMPADFTGGVVDIVTKDFPSREEYSLSVGMSYNPDMHFNSDFLESNTSGTDFLGFDDGERDLPIPENIDIPSPVGSGVNEDGVSLTDITSAFNRKMGADRQDSGADFNFSFSAGNTYNVGENNNKLGYLANISYRNTTEYFEDLEQNFFFKPIDPADTELTPNRTQKGDVGFNNVLLSGLAGLSFKTDYSKYKLNVLHLQNGISRAGKFRTFTFIQDDIEVVRDNAEYTQKSITNIGLTGDHAFEDSSWEVDWGLSTSFSSIEDKDVRVTPFEVTGENQFAIRPSTAGTPQRIWRDLEEINLTGKIDITKKHELFGRKAKLKFGSAGTYKDRDFKINNFNVLIDGASVTPINGNADNLFLPENIWNSNTDNGTFIQGNFQPANTFEANSTVLAAYVSEEFNITDKLKSILGLRFENYTLNYTGQNNQGTVVLDDEEVLSEADLFPSANLIYALTDEINLRTSYYRTTARPSFKEASIAQIFDPLSDITFIGNIDVLPSYINNFDLRIEKFEGEGQMFAFSAFYKAFDDPIELVAFPQAPNNFEPRNVNSADVYGVEFEVRKNFGFITTGLEKFSVNANVSIIESEVKMADREFESRQTAAREGETIDNERDLQGQSPYLINVGLNYDDDEKGWQGGLFYNVQGETLEVVGIRNVPDAFTQPFHNVSFRLTKAFGEDQKQAINIGISNILDDDVETFYKSFGSPDKIFSKRSPGQAFSIGYSYKF